MKAKAKEYEEKAKEHGMEEREVQQAAEGPVFPPVYALIQNLDHLQEI